jgi:hypothetical protein
MSARAYQVREQIEEEHLLKDQLADFWEPRFMDERLMDERLMDERLMDERLMDKLLMQQTTHGAGLSVGQLRGER